MAFSFGAKTNQNTGLSAATATPFSFGGASTAPASSGFGGFGTTTTPAPGFGSFGPAPAAAPFGALGTTTATPSLFGGGAFGTTPAKPGFGTNTFGAGSAFGTSAPAFGAPTSTFGLNTLAPSTLGTTPAFGVGSNFGSNFNAKPAATGFGGFGTSGFGMFAQQPQQQQQQQVARQQQVQQGPSTALEALVAAVFNCSVFGDERDQILAKWNLIQAKWGTGQAYYNRNAPPLELNEQNPLCCFKAVGYSRLGGREDKDGHVALIFQKPEQEIKNNQQQLIASFSSLLGNKPNLAVNIDSVKAVSDNKCQVVIYVVDNAASGCHISATELAGFLNSASPRASLTGAGCSAITAVTRPTHQALTQYLQTPPPGLDMRLWKQAQADNPDAENYIPVPMVGFLEIKFRARCQAEQASLQASWLRRARTELSELRSRRAATAALMAHLAARFHALRHTLLQVITRQEVRGRVGMALSLEEEAARTRLHELVSQLAAPPLYNGRLNELLCAVRLQRSASSGAPHERYQLDPGAQEDVKQYLTMQQRGMAHLLETARSDLSALNTIEDGMSRLVRG